VLIDTAVDRSNKHTDEVIKNADDKIDGIKGDIAVLNQKSVLVFEVKPTRSPDESGLVSMPFVVHNKSSVSTGPFNLWIRLCEGCRFSAGDQSGFQRYSSAGNSLDNERVLHIPIGLDSLIHTDILNVRFFVPDNKKRHYVHFWYSCQFCFSDTTAVQAAIVQEYKDRAVN
jgi:hypothetical protein